MLLLLPVLLLAADLYAGAKVKVKGTVEDVVTRMDGAFDELELEAADKRVDDGWASAVGKDGSGTRLKVAVTRVGEDECEIEISGESPDDAEIEARFLRLMQSR